LTGDSGGVLRRGNAEGDSASKGTPTDIFGERTRAGASVKEGWEAVTAAAAPGGAGEEGRLLSNVLRKADDWSVLEEWMPLSCSWSRSTVLALGKDDGEGVGHNIKVEEERRRLMGVVFLVLVS
jgi:hypothetical protein